MPDQTIFHRRQAPAPEAGTTLDTPMRQRPGPMRRGFIAAAWVALPCSVPMFACQNRSTVPAEVTHAAGSPRTLVVTEPGSAPQRVVRWDVPPVSFRAQLVLKVSFVDGPFEGSSIVETLNLGGSIVATPGGPIARMRVSACDATSSGRVPEAPPSAGPKCVVGETFEVPLDAAGINPSARTPSHTKENLAALATVARGQFGAVWWQWPNESIGPDARWRVTYARDNEGLTRTNGEVDHHLVQLDGATVRLDSAGRSLMTSEDSDGTMRIAWDRVCTRRFDTPIGARCESSETSIAGGHLVARFNGATTTRRSISFELLQAD